MFKNLVNKSPSKKFLDERILGYKKSTPKSEFETKPVYQSYVKKKRPKSSVSQSKVFSKTTKKTNNELSTKETRLPSAKTKLSRPFSSRSVYKNIPLDQSNMFSNAKGDTERKII